MQRFESWMPEPRFIAVISDKEEGDCGRHAVDPRERAAFLAALDLSTESLVTLAQVHSDRVVEAREADRGNLTLAEADGLFTRSPGVLLGISVADCVPVWLLDPVTPAVALLHAGREGTLQKISQAGVHALHQAYGTNPADLTAIIGPSAGPCCYEVSPEMAAEYTRQGLPVKGRFLDLWEENRRQLEKSGVLAPNIHISGECTLCTSRYHSFRKDATRSRNLALAMVHS